MRRLFLLVAVCLDGCSSLAVHWEKPGVDQAMLEKDMSDCRLAARDEAFRNYYPAPGPLFGPRHWLAWSNYAESQRFYAESNLTRFCMRNKGYELVPDQQAKGSEK
ncbi:MAG TPA: hypothetical protein VFB13_12840 [Reyranella sp.]|jgi:hypothetical protein|nr:hypothetical protein [Reyranella sp.]